MKPEINTYIRTRELLEFCDVSCWIGHPFEKVFTNHQSAFDLNNLLKLFDIRFAVVSHTTGKIYDAKIGNAQLIEEIKNFDCMFGAAVLVPEIVSEEYIRELIANKVFAVRLFPKSHNFSLGRTLSSKLLGILEKYQLPLLIWNTEISCEKIASICADFPGLPVIVEGFGRKLFYDNRDHYELIEKYSNFYLSISNLINYLGLDTIVKRFGDRHLVFGSLLPWQDPNAVMMLVTDGEFSLDTKKNIANGNLTKIITRVKRD